MVHAIGAAVRGSAAFGTWTAGKIGVVVGHAEDGVYRVRFFDHESAEVYEVRRDGSALCAVIDGTGHLDSVDWRYLTAE